MHVLKCWIIEGRVVSSIRVQGVAVVDIDWLLGLSRRLDRTFGWDKGGLKGEDSV